MNPIEQTAQKADGPLAGSEARPAALKAELVQGVPVKSPVDSVVKAKPAPSSNPIAQPDRHNPGAPEGEDKELDRILQDVNHSVKKAENGTDEKSGRRAKTREEANLRKPKPEKKTGSPPVAATAVAVIAAAVLITAAFMVFKTG